MTSLLTVDDSPSIRMAIRIALSGAGHGVTEAADGKVKISHAGEENEIYVTTDEAKQEAAAPEGEEK